MYASNLKPGWCRHYTLAALKASQPAVGYVTLEARRGPGHIAPIIKDGRGKYQVLVEDEYVVFPSPFPGIMEPSKGRRFLRKEIKRENAAIRALGIFGDRYTDAHVEIGTEANPATPGPRFECIVGKEREFGLRSNMSQAAQDERTRKAREACGLE